MLSHGFEEMNIRLFVALVLCFASGASVRCKSFETKTRMFIPKNINVNTRITTGSLLPNGHGMIKRVIYFGGNKLY